MRLLKVAKKEFKEFSRDKAFILTLILEPLILMLVFGFTFQADIDHLSTIVIDEDISEYSQQVIGAIDSSDYFNRIDFSGSLEEAKDILRLSEARAVFFIPNNFEDNLKNATQGKVYLYLDSSDYTIYNILRGASGQVVKESLQDIVLLIVDDLESEKDIKQQRVNEIQSLVDGLDESTKNTLTNIDELTKEFNYIRNLLNDTENKIFIAENEISIIESETNSLKSDIDDTLDSLDDLKNSLNQMKQANPGLEATINPIISEIKSMEDDIEDSVSDIDGLNPKNRVQISSEYYNIDEFNQKIDLNEESVSDIDATAKNIERTYRDIQSRMDTIHLELRTLKKEFLSFPMDIEKEFIFGEVSYFQYLTPAIMTLILFFIGVVLTTVNIVDERNSKTLFRISTTPLKKIELFGAKFLIFFLVGIIEAVYVLLLAIFIFNVQIVGNIFSVILVLLLLMASSIGLGLLISAIVKTMRQAVMLVPLVVIPSVLISQTFSPIEVMPQFMQYVAYLSPMFYSNVALREIMIKGTSISGVLSPVIILAIYSVVTLILGILISKKRIE